MFYTLVRKDLLLELRTKEIIIPMFAFGLAIILIFALSFNASQAINHSRKWNDPWAQKDHHRNCSAGVRRHRWNILLIYKQRVGVMFRFIIEILAWNCSIKGEMFAFLHISNSSTINTSFHSMEVISIFFRAFIVCSNQLLWWGGVRFGLFGRTPVLEIRRNSVFPQKSKAR